MILRELEIGDMFIAASEKDALYPVKYIVRNNNMVSINNGIALRKCTLLNGTIVSKMCNLNVIKIGESKFKEKLQKLYGAPNKVKPSAVIPAQAGIS